MSKIIEVKVPDIGSFKDVEIIEVLVDAGFQIEVEDSLITIESDKSRTVTTSSNIDSNSFFVQSDIILNLFGL